MIKIQMDNLRAGAIGWAIGILILLVALIYSFSASAENVICSTASPGTNNNQCASTAFVTGAVAVGGLTINSTPITGGTNNGLLYDSAGFVGNLATGVSGVLVTDGAGVPSISSTLPSVVQGNITSTGTVTSGVWNGTAIDLAHGGTNANLTASIGGIFYSDATKGQILSGSATARQMLQSGASVAPAWSTATWPATTTINQLLYSSSTNTVVGLTTVGAGVLNTDASGVPLLTQNPRVGGIGIGTGSYQVAGTIGGVITIQPQNSTTTYNFNLPTSAGSVGQLFQSAGGGATANTWTTATYPATATATGTILRADGTNWVASTATYPATATGTGTILRADGTNWAATTATYPATTTINQILFSSSANVVDGITTAASGVLITSAGGVPSISSTLPSGLAFAGTITAGSLSTVGSIGGSLCATSAGLILYESGVNCFSATATSVTIGTTTVASGTDKGILYQNGASPAGTIGQYTLTGTGTVAVMQTAPTILGHPTVESVTSTGATGTGKFVFDTAPSVSSLTVTTAFTATGLVTNADLTNPATTVNGVTCTLGSTCTVLATSAPQGRLTLTSGTAVMISGVAGATTLYYTPSTGQLVPIYDGSKFVMTDTGGELSQATTDSTKSPAAVAASQIYDIFVWNDSGTIRATRGPTWATGGGSSTARGTGAGSTALTLLKGYYVNTNAITNGPGANLGTYVGTVISDGSSQLDMTFGGAASGGTAAVMGVWNAYNRVDTVATITDSGTNYTYTSATIRQARASAGNQATFISGLQQDTISTTYAAQLFISPLNSIAAWGIGLDSTSTFNFQRTFLLSPTVGGTTGSGPSTGMIAPQLGQHIISANEASDGTNANTFNNAPGTNVLFVLFRM